MTKNPPKARPIPKILFAATLITAYLISPERMRFNVSKENAEKVVKPPSSPINKNVRRFMETRPVSLNPARIPMIKEPQRLTINVPQGKIAVLKK